MNIDNYDTPEFTEEDEAYIAEQIRLRDEAEAAGLWDDTMEEPAKKLNLTNDQEYILWQAMSSLAQLAKETNSSLSELIASY